MSQASTFALLSNPSRYVCRNCLKQLRRPAAASIPSQKRRITRAHIHKIKEAQDDWRERAQQIEAGRKQSMLSLLEERGYVNQIIGDREKLDYVLTTKRIGAYVGVDPTGPSLHVGHILPFMALSWLYVHGYAAVFLLGGSTAKVGDPTDRSAPRPLQSSSTRKANTAVMHMQLKKLTLNLDSYASYHGYQKEWAWRRDVENNGRWYQKLNLIDFLQNTGNSFRIGPMLGRETVKNRLSKGGGMSFTEFAYPLMQAYDWWQLYDSKGVQLQIGGADQYGNILAGAESVKYLSKNFIGPATAPPPPDHDVDIVNEPKKAEDLKAAYGFTVPLLTTSSGEKIGKSAGNAIWLDNELTSVFDLYQYFLRLSDDDVERYLKLFTFIPLPEIRTIMAEHIMDQSKRVAQHALARDFVHLVHGKEAAAEAESHHRMLFRPMGKTTEQSIETVGDSNPRLNKYAPQTNANNMGSMKVKLPRSLVFGQGAHKILWSAGLVATKGEGHRLISTKGAYVAGKSGKDVSMSDDLSFRPIPTTSTQDYSIEQYIVDGDTLILRVGKWKVRIINIVSDDEYEASGLSCPGWKEDPNEGKEDYKQRQQEHMREMELRKTKSTGQRQPRVYPPSQHSPLSSIDVYRKISRAA